MNLPDRALHNLEQVAHRFREDAQQEAYLAMLEGRSPVTAIKRYVKRELEHEEREMTRQARDEARLNGQQLRPSWLYNGQDQRPELPDPDDIRKTRVITIKLSRREAQASQETSVTISEVA